jgi:hypothetical protein
MTCIANVMIGLLLMCADITISFLLMFTCQWHYWSPVVKMTSLVSLHLYDLLNKTHWHYYHVVPSPSIN